MSLAARLRPHDRPPPPALPADAALLLDFDGTLVDIAPRPEAVRVPPALPLLLEGLQRRLRGAIAIVSGRRLFDLDRMLWPLELAGAGVHGAELRRVGGGAVEACDGPDTAALARALQLRFGSDARILVEDKRHTVALHYRLAPEREADCRRALQAVLPEGFELLPGHCVLEARPRGVNKRRAIEELLRHPPFAGRRPVFVGDDFTDEEGFAAAQAAGGFAVRVGAGATDADHRLADAGAVLNWLRRSLAAG